jgi:hypothetical protein
MKKTILTLLVAIGSLISNAQDLIPTPKSNLIGLEVGLKSIDDGEGCLNTRQEVGFINSNFTAPQKIQEFVDKLKSTNSTNDKIAIIKEYKDDYKINQLLKYTYSPFKQFHVTSATVKKNKKLERDGYQ